MITVRIAGKPPGPILDSTRIVVEEFHEVQDIVIAGLVEGITASPSSYAIRPAHLEAKQIPALRLIGFTESPRSELEIDEVTANQPNVTFHLDQSRRLKPLAIEPLGTRREWTIPVTVESPIRSGNFTITVGYRLNQGDRQLVHVDANILTK